jgi:hypothetical protein
MDFGTRTYTFNIAPAGSIITESVDVKIRQNIHLVKVGINYRFDLGKAPVIARY